MLVSACRFPFLRIKKPQPAKLGVLIRASITKREARLATTARLQKLLELGEGEDTWDRILADSFPEIPRESSSWVTVIQHALTEVNNHYERAIRKRMDFAVKMTDIVEKEKALAAEEARRVSEDMPRAIDFVKRQDSKESPGLLQKTIPTTRNIRAMVSRPSKPVSKAASLSSGSRMRLRPTSPLLADRMDAYSLHKSQGPSKPDAKDLCVHPLAGYSDDQTEPLEKELIEHTGEQSQMSIAGRSRLLNISMLESLKMARASSSSHVPTNEVHTDDPAHPIYEVLAKMRLTSQALEDLEDSLYSHLAREIKRQFSESDIPRAQQRTHDDLTSGHAKPFDDPAEWLYYMKGHLPRVRFIKPSYLGRSSKPQSNPSGWTFRRIVSKAHREVSVRRVASRRANLLRMGRAFKKVTTDYTGQSRRGTRIYKPLSDGDIRPLDPGYSVDIMKTTQTAASGLTSPTSSTQIMTSPEDRKNGLHSPLSPARVSELEKVISIAKKDGQLQDLSTSLSPQDLADLKRHLKSKLYALRAAEKRSTRKARQKKEVWDSMFKDKMRQTSTTGPDDMLTAVNELQQDRRVRERLSRHQENFQQGKPASDTERAGRGTGFDPKKTNKQSPRVRRRIKPSPHIRKCLVSPFEPKAPIRKLPVSSEVYVRKLLVSSEGHEAPIHKHLASSQVYVRKLLASKEHEAPLRKPLASSPKRRKSRRKGAMASPVLHKHFSARKQMASSRKHEAAITKRKVASRKHKLPISKPRVASPIFRKISSHPDACP